MLAYRTKRLNSTTAAENQEALKSLARCFREALDATPFAYYVNVGEADAGAALHLLGCGVDPSMFLTYKVSFHR